MTMAYEWSEIDLTTTDIASIEECTSEQRVRHLQNSLYTRGEGMSELVVPKIEYTPLSVAQDEVRLLKVHPTDDVSKHICCDLEIHSLDNLPPFIAIQNARGYRLFEEAIEVDGKARLISVALERFLRYLRTRIRVPTRIWVRYACVLEFNPQEQKTYWTRKFSDTMYSLAAKVFDMHETNNRLIKNGYFEKIIDSQCTERNKEWYGMPDELVLPRICPVRLGSKHDNDGPTAPYQYMPLDVLADEIRIICIMPANDIATPIIMHVAHCPIRSEVTFIALSYCWGTDTTPEKVTLNGQIMLIRKNLAEAIRDLRSTNTIVPLWIDALSINQDDTLERSRQVRSMGHIYNNATMVYSWIGSAAEDTIDACNFIAELNKHPMVRINAEGEFHFGEWGLTDGGDIWYGANTMRPPMLARMCAALYKLLTRTYFRRSWILQEVAMASNPTIVAGGKLAIGFGSLDKAVYNFHAMLARDPSLAAQVQDVEPTLTAIKTDMLAYPRKLFYLRHLLSSNSTQGLPFFTMKKTSPGFLEGLVLARDFECSDPRDRIFALWNLARDKSGLQFAPDYSKSYETVYTDFAQAWIMQQSSLDILGAVECTRASAGFYASAPSWCANWNVRATASCLVRKDYLPIRFMSAVEDQGGHLYSADGNVCADTSKSPPFSFERNALHCTGIIVDSIKQVFDDAPDIPAGTAPKSTWRFHYWMDAIKKYFGAVEQTQYKDPLQAAHAMFHGDSIEAWPPTDESGYGPNTYHSGERYLCRPTESRHVLVWAGSYDRTEAWTVVDTVLRGRRPFISQDGYMGLVPSYVLTNGSEEQVLATLQIAIVAGCSVPLLLRVREDATYELVGTCFLQGWMNGEWVQTLMGAEDPHELWDALGDGARLVIT